jgi:uncharacterized protein with gpF-like domain
MAFELRPGNLAVSSARLPFAEQIAFFRAKLGNLIPTERWTDVWKEAHDKGFMVAGAQKAELLADLAQAVDGAIADGKGIEWFRANFDSIVGKHGWDYRGERNWRTRVIYRTNIATSYAAGRLAQMRASGLPYWMYKHSDAVLHPRPLHVSWDGLTLPADHPWFKTHGPPNGWGCMCRLVAVSERTARALGGRITDTPPDDGTEPDGRPKGIDKGWDYMPGDTVSADVQRWVGKRAATLPQKIGAVLLSDTNSELVKTGGALYA